MNRIIAVRISGGAHMNDNSELFLSIDAGTSSVKIVLFDSYGTMKAVSLQEYSLLTPAENLVELHPETYWECCAKGIEEITAQIGGKEAEKIRSVGICSQGETLILLDKNGDPLHNAVVWIDNRSTEEAEEIKERFGINQDTGQPDVYPMWPVTKMLWFKKHKPDLFEAVDKFLLVEDYLVYRLTGRFSATFALYTSSYLLDIRKKQWWKAMLDYIGVRENQLPELHESGRIVGNLRPSAAERLHLSKKTVVVSGAMDQTAALVGAAAVKEGVVIETTGSAVVVCQAGGVFPEGRRLSLPLHYHAIPDMYFLLSMCSAGGLSFKWLRDNFFRAEADSSAKNGEDVYSLMTARAETIAPGSGGLLFYPFMSGPGTLPVDPELRGIMFGLQLHHEKGHFARSIMEAIAFVIRESLEQMAELGFNYREIRSLGGGAKSVLWTRIKAAVLDRPLTIMKCPETAALGTAALQAAALGVYPDIQSAAEAMSAADETVEPEAALVSVYEEVYNRYRTIEKKYFAAGARDRG